jgi:hypothetical protein
MNELFAQLFGQGPSYANALYGEDEAARLRQQAQQQGLMNVGLSLLAGSGPSPQRRGLGQLLAQGVAAGQQAYQGAYNRALQEQAMKEQIAERQQLRQEQQAAQALLPQILRPGATQEIYGEDIMGQRVGEGVRVGQPQIDMNTLQRLLTQAPNVASKVLPTVEAFRKLNAPERIKLGAEETLTEITPEGQARVVATGAGKPEKQTTEFQNYQNAIRDGSFKGSFLDYQMALKRAGAQQQTVNLPAAEKAFETKAGSLMAESYGEVAKQGVASSRALGTLTRLESLLDKTGGGLVPALQSFAGQFGIKSKGSSDIEAAQAVINRLVPEQRAPGSGTMSDRDIELFKASLPRLINTPEGNRQILEAMRGIVEYDIKAGQIARDALNGRIKQDEAEKRLNDLRNPLEQFRSQARLKFNPQTGRLE